jgi:hypothetical protein
MKALTELLGDLKAAINTFRWFRQVRRMDPDEREAMADSL